MKKAKTIADISGRRWNQIINAVNDKKSPDVINPPLDEVEMEVFNDLENKKKEADAKNSFESFFDTVEIEYDDPCLDIYNN